MSGDKKVWSIVLFESGPGFGPAEIFSFTGTFAGAKKEARYWVRRRLEKGGWDGATHCTIGESVDPQKWVDGFRDDENKLAAAERERQERAELERLNAKYGGAE